MGVSVPQRLAFTVWYRCVLWAGGSSAPRGLAPGSRATPEAVPARSQQIAPRVQARALIAGTAPSGMTLPQAAHTALGPRQPCYPPDEIRFLRWELRPRRGVSKGPQSTAQKSFRSGAFHTGVADLATCRLSVRVRPLSPFWGFSPACDGRLIPSSLGGHCPSPGQIFPPD